MIEERRIALDVIIEQDVSGWIGFHDSESTLMHGIGSGIGSETPHFFCYSGLGKTKATFFFRLFQHDLAAAEVDRERRI